MSKSKPSPWILMENNFPLVSHQKVVSRVMHPEGWSGHPEEFVVTDDMAVYQSFPMLNLFTGENHELWLSRDQIHEFREITVNRNRNHHDVPHPRTFELPKIGLIDPQQVDRINGYAEGTQYQMCQDAEGHWWIGSIRDSVHAYLHSPEKSAPQLRFLYPYMTYIGPDENEVWLTPWPWRGTNRKIRLALCTRAVSKVIDACKMQGVFFPIGEARRDAELARQECEALRAELMSTILEADASATNQLQVAQKEAKQAKNEAEQAREQLLAVSKALVDAQKALPADVLEEMARLRREAAHATEMAQKAQEALETARTHNQGWDWSRVLDED